MRYSYAFWSFRLFLRSVALIHAYRIMASSRSTDSLWDVTSRTRDGRQRLPPHSVVKEWASCVESWGKLLGQATNTVAGSWTIHDLAKWLADSAKTSTLQEKLFEGTAALSWLSDVLSLILESGRLELLDEFALLPDQTGVFRSRAQLKWDPGIDDALKDIADQLDVQIRARLLDCAIALPQLEKLLGSESEGKVVDQVLAAARIRKKTFRDAVYIRANVALFGWLLSLGGLNDLDGFPALTLDDEGTVTLAKTSDDEPPLVPMSRWPSASVPYGHLFPKRQILSEQYTTTCAEAHWQQLVDARLVIPGPVYGAPGTVVRFLPDEPFPIVTPRIPTRVWTAWPQFVSPSSAMNMAE